MEVYIDLEALVHNVAILKKQAGDKEIAAVVKGDAYGHDVSLVVPTLLALGMKRFVVSNLKEAYKIWNLGAPWILVLHPTLDDIISFSSLNKTLKKAIRFAIWDSQVLPILSSDIPIHIVLDTGFGMGIGERIIIDKSIRIEGVMGHIPFLNDNREEQLKRETIYSKFMDMLYEYKKRFSPLEIHICNSASLFYLNGCEDTTMVRTGVGLYGYIEVKRILPMLKPVMWQIAEVIGIKRIKRGESVFYGEIASRDMNIAFVRAGYGDGYVGGRYAYHLSTNAYLERVFHLTMNVSAFEIKNGKVKVGSKVILMGNKRGIRADEISRWTTFSTEQVLTRAGLSRRKALPSDIKSLLQS